MTLLFYLMAGSTAFCLLGLLASVMVTRTARASGDRLIEVAAGNQRSERAKPRALEAQTKVFNFVRNLRGRFGMMENAKLLERFSQAGSRSSAHRDLYFAARMLGPVLALTIASFIHTNRFFWIAAIGGLFYLAPDIILTRLIKARREKIRLGVPDAVDLLVICVDAGLGLDQAMLRVGQELLNSHPEIYQEFMQINREQRAGQLRLQAWQAMADRSQLPEVNGFVNMLMQTERFGTPIARALSNYGDAIRLKRRQRAEELAAKTTVKIIFPLVLFIFPSMFIVLLGPAAINIARGLASY